jgi:conjugal transfer/entry exclusion protein
MHKLFINLVICAAIALQPFTGFAGSVAGTGGSTEVTQLLNNAQLIKVQADGAVTAAKQIQAYLLQLQQYQTQVLNLKSLASLPAGLSPDVLSQIQQLSSYKDALTALQGDLTSQGTILNQRLAEARLSGLSWNDYLQNVSSDVAMHQGRAVQRLQYEQSVLKQVNSDYDFARNLQPAITGTEGLQQSTQMLNSQMNRVVTQNAKMIEVMTMSLHNGAEDDAKKAVDQQQLGTNLDLLRQRQQSIQDRQNSFGGFQQ